jgi:hypothetical protein
MARPPILLSNDPLKELLQKERTDLDKRAVEEGSKIPDQIERHGDKIAPLEKPTTKTSTPPKPRK